MSNSETLKRINRAKKLIKDALILLEDLDLEKPNGTPGEGIDCPASLKEAPDPSSNEYANWKNRRDYL